MRLKLYRAPDVAAALALVRAELGPDALILATRRVGDGVELTAALEPSAPEPIVDAAREAALAWHGVPPGLAGRLLSGPLDAALAASLPFRKLPLETGDPPLLLVGPPGGGKTLTVARLAARLVLSGTAPLAITADGQRAGATEQLAAFTRLLGLTLVVASQPVTLARALARRQGGAPVLIDAPGGDPFDPAYRDLVSGLAATAGATVALVLPAGYDAHEAADLAGAFAELGATYLVPTRLDLARRLGAVLSAAAAGPALAEAGIGPGVADGLAALTPALLARRLMNRAGRRPAAQALDAA